MKITSVALAALALAPLAPTPAQQVAVGAAPVSAWVTQSPEDEPPKLGVMVSETDDGVLISEILDGSLAEAAGLQAEDVLFRIGGERIDAIADIPEALGAYGPGDDVTVTVIRPGEGLVTLVGRRPEPVQEIVEPEDVWTHEGGGAFLGVEIGAAADGGVRVAGVFEGSAAWYVGLSEGDTLLELGGYELDSPEELAELVGRHAPGDLVELAYSHDGQRHDTRMRLGHRMAAGNPLGGLFAPQGNAPFGLSDGNVFVLDPEGLHEDLGFFGDDGDVVLFGDDHGGLQWLHDGQGQHGAMEELLHKHLEMLEHGDHHDDDHHGDHHEARELRIQIQDGVMTIDRDGEVEVIELEAGSGDGQRTSFRLHGDDQDVVAQVVALTSDLEAECDALAAECEALVEECEALAAECEQACEADAQVQTVALAVETAAECEAVADACAESVAECEVAVEACADAVVECEVVVEACADAAEDCESACEDETSCCEETEACDEDDDEDAVT